MPGEVLADDRGVEDVDRHGNEGGQGDGRGGRGLQLSVDGVVWHCCCFRWGGCLLRGRTSLKLQQQSVGEGRGGGGVSSWRGEGDEWGVKFF